MSLDAYIYYGHSDQLPHCEIKRVPDEPPLEAEEMSYEYVSRLLHEVGEDTIPVIGDTAVRLDGCRLEEVLSDVAIVCDIHTIADPSSPHAETIDDYFISGGSLI